MPYRTADKPHKRMNICIIVIFAGLPLEFRGHMTERFKKIKILEHFLFNKFI